MTSRTLHKDVSEVPVLVEPSAAEAFIPGQTDAPSAPEAARETAQETAQREKAQTAPSETAEDASSRLSDRDRAVLTFEKQYWKYSGAKEQAIRDRFEMSATRYYQVLNALLDRPEAQEFEPALVKRLRRERATKRARSGRVRPQATAP